MNTNDNREMSKEEVKRTIEERAKEFLNLSGNCAQSSFAALQEHFGLESEDILKALTPFPGLALRGEACGAVVGSLMAVGLVYGRDELSNQRGYLASLSSARKFCSAFEKEYDSTSCAKILNKKMGREFNLADAKESKEYLLAGGQEICGAVVAHAVKNAALLIGKKIKIV
jgi:C_GCAxxG_C_C family probable redox protein